LVIDDEFIGGYKSSNIGVLLNVKIAHDFTEYFSAYVGGGIGLIRNEYTHMVQSSGIAPREPDAHSHHNTFAWQVTAGVEFSPIEQFAFFAQYRYLSGGEIDVINGNDSLNFTSNPSVIEDSFVEVGARFYF